MRHPDSETLAAFAEGQLDRGRRAEVLEHLDVCEDCMPEATLAIRTFADEQRATPTRLAPRRMWIGVAAAAAILAAIFGIPALVDRTGDDAIERLVDAALQSARVVEPRLSGGFAWATYHGAARASGTKANAETYKLAGVAGEIVQRAETDRDARAQHAAGVALVLMQDPIGAIAHLEAAVKTHGDADAWSDLAAARYAAAAELSRASLYPDALAAADAALRADADHGEALFNRALILERMGLFDRARQAWTRYLEADASSPWASEARARLRELPATTRSSEFNADRPRAERAALGGDTQTLRTLIDRHRERARAFAEAESLGQWADAVLANDDAAAWRQLTVARAFGKTLRELSGESLLFDAVAAIDTAPPHQRRILADGHAAYRRGRIAYSRQHLDDARRELLHAAESFEAARSPMALLARYYAAGVQAVQHDFGGARAELERLASVSQRYLVLPAAIRWELGRIHIMQDDAAAAAAVLADGAALYRRAGERANEAFLEAMRAAALLSLGRADDGWDARIRAFAALSREGMPNLLATTIGNAVRSELLSGRHEPALTLLRLDSTSGEGIHPTNVFNALVWRAMLEAAAGHHASARATVQRARAAAQQLDDESLRRETLVAIDVADGAANAASDPRAATASLTRAIEFYRAHDRADALPEPLLLRAGCALREGDARAALRDLDEGMSLAERSRDEVLGTGVLRAEHALFEEAIRLALDGSDTARAFTLAERASGAAFTLGELQQRLRGGGSAVLRVITLPDEIAVIAIDEHRVAASRRKRASESLADLAGASLTENGTTAAAALYDDFIRPAGTILAGARELIIVPDRRTAAIPWAALYDSVARRHLIEQLPVAVATRASSLTRDEDDGAIAAATLIALPAAADAAALPETTRELHAIASVYPRASLIAREQATLAAARESRGILHLAGHTERQPAGGEHALLFASANGIERVTARAIAAGPPLHARVVVLAACQTMRAPASELTRAASLAEAFAAAGAREVVGTLTPIGDRDARRLFEAFHRELARGARASAALQAAQRAAIDEQNSGGSRAWRQVALLTRNLPRKESRS